MFDTSKEMIARYAHIDSPCPDGFEGGKFILFGAHHGRSGYGAWIKEAKPAGEKCSPSGEKDKT